MTTRMKIVVLAFALLAGAMLPGVSRAIQPVEAYDLSLAMTSAPSAVGVRVVGLNPAFLALKRQPWVSISLPLFNFGIRFGNDAYTNKDIATYFRRGMYWDDEIKRTLADKVTGDKLNFNNDMYARLLGVSFPTTYLDVAFTVDMGMSIDADLDDEFTDIALLGNGLDNLGQQKEFAQTDGSGIWLTRLGATFAKSFQYAEEVEWMDEFTAGVTFNYFIGHSFVQIDEFHGSFLADYDGTASQAYFEVIGAGRLSTNGKDDFYDPDYTSGGGVGLDLGLGFVVLDGRATVGFSVINLVNQMTWSDGKRAVYAFNTEGIPLEGMNGEGWWDNNFAPVDTLFEERENLKTELPRLIKMNSSFGLNEQINLTGEFTAQTNNVIGADAFLRGGAGIEHNTLPWLTLRGGVSVGGRSGLAFGGGFGLHAGIWQTDIGFGWEHGLFDFAKGMRFGINTVFLFYDPDTFHRTFGTGGDRNGD